MKLAGIESIAASTERACKAKKPGNARAHRQDHHFPASPIQAHVSVRHRGARSQARSRYSRTPDFPCFQFPDGPHLRPSVEPVHRPAVGAKEQPDRRPSKRRQQSGTALRRKIHIATNERLYPHSRRHHDQVDIETLLTVEAPSLAIANGAAAGVIAGIAALTFLSCCASTSENGPKRERNKRREQPKASKCILELRFRRMEEADPARMSKRIIISV